ncbi:S1C family serine protease [Alicyclobacillus tolerans]|uniref:S1C family serine protease n=1 Tax=Alicyclobacillus tolerans TaxID=90970 RepID=UPI003B785E4C
MNGKKIVHWKKFSKLTLWSSAPFLLACLLSGCGHMRVGASSTPIQPIQLGVNTPSSITPSVGDVSNIYAQAVPSICTITSVHQNHTSDNEPTEDIGTGFIIDNQGDIATNDHVIAGSETVLVAIGSQTYQGRVLGTDKLDDLAIVRIPTHIYRPLSLGTATDLRPGQNVIAIGNPFQLTDTVTSGIISGLHRSMPSIGQREMNDLIQTDAPINPGNSGGPLLNANGQVIGINTMIVSPVKGSIGIGFAIPIDRLKKVMPDLLSGKQVKYPWIGITGYTVTPILAQHYHLPAPYGVLVIQVLKNGPAAQAGLRGIHNTDSANLSNAELITAVNGKAVHSVSELTSTISEYRIGQKIYLTVFENKRAQNIPLILGTFPEDE